MADPKRRQFLYLTLSSGATVVFGCGGGKVGEPFTGLSTSGGLDDDDDSDPSGNAVTKTGGETEAGSTGSSGDSPQSGGPASTGEHQSTGGESSTGEPDWMCDDPFAGGMLLGTMNFVGEDSSYIGVKTGNGRDCRLAFDLERLTEDAMTVANEDFFIRTEAPNQIDFSQPWSIAIDGLVGQTLSLSIADLAALEQKTEIVVLECSGNGDFSHYGLMSATEFSGVPMSAILDLVDIDPSGTRVLVNGFDETTYTSTHSTPGASWIFTLADLAQAGAFLATHMGGVPLPPDHGQPVRLIIPGWYGCCNIKWVDRITLVDQNAASTAQMREFASRTHQNGTPTLARDFRPAIMQQAAMPIRVEKWDLDGQIAYRVVGILWGGVETTDALQMRVDGGAAVPVEVCPPHLQNKTWTLWSHLWRPSAPGNYRIDLEIADPAVPTNRLDSGFYSRVVNVDQT